MLNMSQLVHYIDSLNGKYNNPVNTQVKEFLNTRVYMEKNVRGFQALNPTNTSRPKPTYFDAIALFDSLPGYDKRTVVGKAMENLKEGSSYLTTTKESLEYEVRNIKKYEIELNKKLTLSFACIVFFFIGAPLGAIIRKGGLGTPAVISILFFVIWYVISLSGEKLVEADRVGTLAGMWAASYILLPVGIFLTYKASTDSVIMNIDTYSMFLKKIKDLIYTKLVSGTRIIPDFKKKRNNNGQLHKA
jgi:lipopolysaccharide export system permease protein